MIRWGRALQGVAAAAELRWRLARDRRWAARHPFYRHLPRLRVPLSLIDGRIAVDVTARFVYYRIPKAANSTVIWSLYRTVAGQEAQSKPVADIEAVKAEAFARPSRLPAEAAAQAATTFRHFTVVRNPFTRLASAYLDKIAGGEPQAKRVARALGMPPGAVHFNDFLDFLEHLNGLRRNAHWAPQTELVPLPPEQLTYIAYTECLDRDLPGLLQALYPRHAPRVESYEHKKGYSGKREAGAKSRSEHYLVSLYDRGAQERVARLYSRDFAVLGYDPERLPEVD